MPKHSARKTTRKYSPRTVALLFGLSGNRCANPDCSNRIISDATLFDEAAVNGHIAHVRASSSSDRAPRSQPPEDFDPKFIDSFENLILLCQHCHSLIDKQPNTFSAELIQSWKAAHLERNLKTRSSLLPERDGDCVFLGLRGKAYTADGMLIAIGVPHKEVKQVAPDKYRHYEHVTYFFEFHNGEQFHLRLTNSRFECAVGTRITLLFITFENDDAWPFSIYNHAINEWVPLPRPAKTDLFTRKEAKIGVAILLPPMLIWMAYSSFYRDSSLYAAAVGLVIAFSFLGFHRLREELARRRLQALQAKVIIS